MTIRPLLAELLLGISVLACTRSDVPLAAPVQMEPQTGSVFDNYPRTTTLVWSRVPGAISYSVEVDPYCADRSMWCTEAGVSQMLYTAAAIKDTTHSFEHIGAQPGRWRVWAVNNAGVPGPKSEWWRFKYTR